MAGVTLPVGSAGALVMSLPGFCFIGAGWGAGGKWTVLIAALKFSFYLSCP